jgi:hypothetical protein
MGSPIERPPQVGDYKISDVSQNIAESIFIPKPPQVAPDAAEMERRWAMLGPESTGSYRDRTLDSPRDDWLKEEAGFDDGEVGKYTSAEVKELEEEYAKQKEVRERMMYQLAQIAASNSSTPPSGGGQVNVGSRGPIQINPLNPVAQLKQPDILTGPFLGRWRR